ncbi:MAG: DUF4097 family beta strand repeat protein [Planctomycetes bacterium]|nr:DUF4097 family beta strand repeat protein [Planctomycetota bacterium]
MRRTIGFVFLAGLSLLAGVNCVHRFAFSLEPQGVAAEDKVEAALPVAAGAALGVVNPHGPTRVRAGEAGMVRVKARRVLRAETAAEAARLLAVNPLSVESGEKGVAIRQVVVPVEWKSGDTRIRQSGPEVELEIVVPPGTPVQVSAGAGDVTVDGPVAAVDLVSAFGAVSARGVRGDAKLSSKSGNVSLSDAEGERVVVESGFGDATAEKVKGVLALSTASGSVRVAEWSGPAAQLESKFGGLSLASLAGQVTASTSSGDVTAVGLSGGPFKLASSFGALRAEKITGDLDAATRSGDITLSSIEGKTVSARTNYGAVRANAVHADLVARSDSGDLSVQGSDAGRAELRSGFGSISFEGKAGVVAARTASGGVRVRLLGPTKPTGDWELASDFGDVSLSLPAGFSAEVDASTGFGSVSTGRTGLALAEEGKRASGRLGAGGPRVTLRSSSGSVRVAIGE